MKIPTKVAESVKVNVNVDTNGMIDAINKQMREGLLAAAVRFGPIERRVLVKVKEIGTSRIGLPVVLLGITAFDKNGEPLEEESELHMLADDEVVLTYQFTE